MRRAQTQDCWKKSWWFSGSDGCSEFYPGPSVLPRDPLNQRFSKPLGFRIIWGLVQKCRISASPLYTLILILDSWGLRIVLINMDSWEVWRRRWRGAGLGAPEGGAWARGSRGLAFFGGRRRSFELGLGPEASEGPRGWRASLRPAAQPSSLAGRRLDGRSSNRCFCSERLSLPSPQPLTPPRSGRPARPRSPNTYSAGAARMRLGDLGLGFEREEEERRRLGGMQWGTAAGRSASGSSAGKPGGCSV